MNLHSFIPEMHNYTIFDPDYLTKGCDTGSESIRIAADAKAHNEKVLQLNARIADYEKRRQTIR